MNINLNQTFWQQSNPVGKWVAIAMSMFSKDGNPQNSNFSKVFKNSAPECNSSILSIIESNIIPRLLSSRNVDTSVSASLPASRALPSEKEVEEFALMCISDDHLAPQAFINRMLNEGLTKENIFLDLITPAARYLGAQWELNLLDFYLVTHGLVRLHSVTHNIGFSYMDGPLVQGEVRRIMIASAPGSEHLLGPLIVSEFFRKEGWQVVLEISPSLKELVQAVGNEWFDAIGLSISIQDQLSELSSLVSQIKKSSRNPRVAILLGGPIFTLNEYAASDFGASGICTDAKDAVPLALSLMVND